MIHTHTQVRQMFPYKVYGPRGYSEETNEVDDDVVTKAKERNEEIAELYQQEQQVGVCVQNNRHMYHNDRHNYMHTPYTNYVH
jgi:hypothetical protein